MRHAKHALKPVKTTLHDEEISDITLATFHVFDKDALERANSRPAAAEAEPLVAAAAAAVAATARRPGKP